MRANRLSRRAVPGLRYARKPWGARLSIGPSEKIGVEMNETSKERHRILKIYIRTRGIFECLFYIAKNLNHLGLYDQDGNKVNFETQPGKFQLLVWADGPKAEAAVAPASGTGSSTTPRIAKPGHVPKPNELWKIY
jgi:hypothetical protein